MLTVATYLDRSTLHGIGLFAGEPISAGTVVWRFNPRLDLEYGLEEWLEIAATASPHSFSHVRRYSYKEGERIYLCLDNAQFMNHGEETANVANIAPDNTMRAIRDIARGEELLCNYFEYCDGDDYNLVKIRAAAAQATGPTSGPC